MTAFAGFGPEAFRFLRGLARNNRKAWFEAHRASYETGLRTPMRALVEELDVRLARVAPEIVGDPRRSLFRIHRDIRFSRDKSPYKTNAGCWLYHRDAGRAVGQEAVEGSAGFYFHFEPGKCFVAGGLWMPPRTSLARIRDAIARAPSVLAKLESAPGFRRRFGRLDRGASLSRVPRGFDPTHQAADWLRLRSFTAGAAIDDAIAGSRRLVDHLTRDFERLAPLVRWLNGALGYAPARSRL